MTRYMILHKKFQIVSGLLPVKLFLSGQLVIHKIFLIIKKGQWNET